MDDHYAHDLLNTCKLHTGFLVPVYIVTLSTISGCAGFTAFHTASLRHSLSSGFQIVSPFTLLDSQLFQLPFALLFRIAIGASGIGSPSTLESRSTPEGSLSPYWSITFRIRQWRVNSPWSPVASTTSSPTFRDGFIVYLVLNACNIRFLRRSWQPTFSFAGTISVLRHNV